MNGPKWIEWVIYGTDPTRAAEQVSTRVPRDIEGKTSCRCQLIVSPLTPTGVQAVQSTSCGVKRYQNSLVIFRRVGTFYSISPLPL